MKRVLLVIPPSRELYSRAKVKVAVPERPSLTFATLAAPLLQAGHRVEILDLDIARQPGQALERKLDEFSPDYVGITCTTPLVDKARHVASMVKKHNPDTTVIVGGAHPSSLPESTLRDSALDIACIGEGDFTITEIVSGAAWASIKGICYQKDGRVIANPERERLADLDQLPFPAWSLFHLKNYRVPRLTCRKNPVGTMETSRGCVFGCTYCNKNIFGRTFRMKSAQRVVDEMEHMLGIGFKEIHIMDDGFTTDLGRAKRICDLILARGLKFLWNLHNGIRVDRVDKEFLEKAQAAGCYGITFGVESGDQTLLDNVHKGITLEKIRQVFKWARETGMETLAFFMIGLPGETEKTMQKTIDFAKELDPDYTKVSILLPLPGTPLYRDFEQRGYIKSRDWSLYNQHDPSQVYDHPNLNWETIRHYYDLFYRGFYLRPHTVLKQLKKDAFSTNLLYDFAYVLRTRW
jgi:radical SAM superfamily enzyme YgiQ (UPF0313 family)